MKPSLSSVGEAEEGRPLLVFHWFSFVAVVEWWSGGVVVALGRLFPSHPPLSSRYPHSSMTQGFKT